MSTVIAIGFSQADDASEAAHQAAVAAKNQLNSITTDLVVIFASIHYAKPEILEVIHTILKPVKLVGASTAGVILSNGIFTRGLAILAINSDSMAFGIGAAVYSPDQDLSQIGFELGRRLTNDYKSSQSRRASVILCEGLFQNVSQLIPGIQNVLGQGSPIMGGCACDDFKLQRTYQFYQKQLFSNAAIGFVIGSRAPIHLSSKHGFKPLGKPRLITQTENNIIHTIDGRPAFEIYVQYLKEEAQNLKKGVFNSPVMFYPLGLYSENLHQYLLRYPVDILTDGSIVCQADIPSNAEVHLTISNKDSLKNAAMAAAQEIKDALSGRPAQLIIVFESMLRYRSLGSHSMLELQVIKEILGYSIPVIGMCTFGEIAPLGLNTGLAGTYLQNGSLLLLAIS